MANSGIEWIDFVFDTAVRWLLAIGDLMGITYEEVNVWLFCIIWPLVTLSLIASNVVLLMNSRNLKLQLQSKTAS